MKIAVGVERFDYTKGILDRMRAVDELLTLRPEWKGSSSCCRSPRQREAN